MKIIKPKIPSKLETTDSIDLCIANAFESDLPIENHHFQKDLLRYKDANKIEFKGCIFENIDLNHMELENGYLLDCLFMNCDLSNIDFKSSLLRRVQFKNCKLTGADLSKAMFDHVCFENSQMNYVNFSSTKNKALELKNTLLTESSFNECDLSKTFFTKCNLAKCEFIQTPLKNIDLSSCDISGILINLHHLNGAIISESQAIDIAQLLGIKIK